MPQKKSYWLSPDGSVVTTWDSAADFVKKNPNKFKIDKDRYEQLLDKYEESTAKDRRARTEFFIELTKEGWIIITLHPKSDSPVHLWDFTYDKKTRLWNFIVEQVENENVSRFKKFETKDFKTESEDSFEANDIIKGDIFEQLSVPRDYTAANHLSRAWDNITDPDKNLAVLSAYLGDSDIEVSEEENRERHIRLKKEVFARELGFIELESFQNDNENGAKTESLLIINIDKNEAQKLAQKFDQCSFIYKNSNKFEEVAVHPEYGSIGETLDHFEAELDNQQLNEQTKSSFASLLRKAFARQSKHIYKVVEKEQGMGFHRARLIAEKNEMLPRRYPLFIDRIEFK